MALYREFKVTAQSFERQTGVPTAAPREEIIRPHENDLFKRCQTILDVKEKYENFWNHLNSDSEEIVFVQSIIPS